MRYWLMKSEPDTYSIDDLAKASEPAMWEGCRNYTVRNFFRDSMADGDLAFFHHSNATPSGIVGTMRICGDAFPDPTQFDPNSDYFDPKAPADGSRWICRNVQLVRKFDRIIPISEMRETPGLEAMLLLARGQRLSVMPVTEAEWNIINGLQGL